MVGFVSFTPDIMFIFMAVFWHATMHNAGSVVHVIAVQASRVPGHQPLLNRPNGTEQLQGGGRHDRDIMMAWVLMCFDGEFRRIFSDFYLELRHDRPMGRSHPIALTHVA